MWSCVLCVSVGGLEGSLASICHLQPVSSTLNKYSRGHLEGRRPSQSPPTPGGSDTETQVLTDSRQTLLWEGIKVWVF